MKNKFDEFSKILAREQYKHHDEAGHAFGNLMGRIQRIFDVEVGANIIQYGDEDFRLEDLVLGIKDGVRIPDSSNEGWFADIHTHPPSVSGLSGQFELKDGEAVLTTQGYDFILNINKGVNGYVYTVGEKRFGSDGELWFFNAYQFLKDGIDEKKNVFSRDYQHKR